MSGALLLIANVARRREIHPSVTTPGRYGFDMIHGHVPLSPSAEGTRIIP